MNAAELVIEWIKQAYKLPIFIFEFYMSTSGDSKWHTSIVIKENVKSYAIPKGSYTDASHHLDLLYWDGGNGFLGANHRFSPLYITDPDFFKKLRRTIITPTFKDRLYLPSHALRTRTRSKV